MRNWYLGNCKKGENPLSVLTGGAKNEIMGPSGPPYAPMFYTSLTLKSVKDV